MLEFLRYDGRKRLSGSVVLAAGLSLLATLVIWVYPSIQTAFEDDELLAAYPDELLRLLDVQTVTSLAGFLAFEFYVFGWTILLGLYLAYSAAGAIADDVDRGRMDSLLSMPVSRTRLLVERFGALGVPILTVNLLVPPVVLAGAALIDEPLSATAVLGVHLLSVPYLFACAGIGLVCSVVVDRVSVAQRLALGVVFGLFLVESVLQGTEYEAVGSVAPMRYFDPNAVLLDGQYDLIGAVVLVAMTVGFVLLSAAWFRRVDL